MNAKRFGGCTGEANANLRAAAPRLLRERGELIEALQWIAKHDAEFGAIEDEGTQLLAVIERAIAALARMEAD